MKKKKFKFKIDQLVRHITSNSSIATVYIIVAKAHVEEKSYTSNAYWCTTEGRTIIFNEEELIALTKEEIKDLEKPTIESDWPSILNQWKVMGGGKK